MTPSGTNSMAERAYSHKRRGRSLQEQYSREGMELIVYCPSGNLGEVGILLIA
jgi:hypothetical protein